MRVEGKVVLITGASEGIGAACAAEFRRYGAVLSLVARSREKLEEVAGSDGLAIPADLLDPASRQMVVERTLERFGRIDILVNNAGIGLYAPVCFSSMEEARAMFELNFFAPLELIRLAAPHMKRQGSGAIVNVGSIAGKVTLPWFTLYSASKYALGSLTDGLRMELRRSGIHCMTVCPGYVKTGFQSHVLSGKVPEAVGGMKSRWAITPEECAQAIVKGLERDARTVVAPAAFGWLFIMLNRLFPSVVDRRLEAMYWKQETRA
jgi:short-subunit dehydrogenase